MKNKEIIRNIFNIFEFIEYIKYNSIIYLNYNYNYIIIKIFKYYNILFINNLII